MSLIDIHRTFHPTVLGFYERPPSPSILLQMAKCHSFSLDERCTCVCVCESYLLYPFICRWLLTLLHAVAIVNKVSVNIACMHLFELFSSSVFFFFFYPFLLDTHEWFPGLYGSFTYSFLRNLHTGFHSGCTNFTPSSSVGGSLSPHACQHLLFVFFLMIAILRDAR